MPDTSLKKIIVPALLTTGAVFTALATPVVMFGSEKLEIEHGSQSVFSGTVREAAIPYLSLAALASLGLGVTGVGIQGWRKNAKQVEQLDNQVTHLQQRLTEREHHLKAALTSDNYLETTGLKFFLEDETAIGPDQQPAPASLPQPVTSVAQSIPAVQPMPVAVLPKSPALQPMPSVLESFLDPMLEAFLDPDSTVALPFNSSEKYPQPTAHSTPANLNVGRIEAKRSGAELSKLSHTPAPTASYEISTPIAAIPTVVFEPALPTMTSSAAVQSVVSPLTAAQGFLSFTRTAPATVQPTIQPAEDLTIAKIQSLQTQLQQIVTQIEALQTNLPGTPETKVQVVQEFTPNQAAPARSYAQEAVWLTRRAAS